MMDVGEGGEKDDDSGSSSDDEDKLVNQKSGDEGRDMEEEIGSSGGKELDNQKMIGGVGEKADDDSGSNRNDEVICQIVSERRKTDKVSNILEKKYQNEIVVE